MITRRHTNGLAIPDLDNHLRRAINVFVAQEEQWRKWVGKNICDEDAEECFRAIPNVSEKRVQQLMTRFGIECKRHGRTVWALYSAATFFASATEGEFKVRETNSDHQAVTLLNRERQVCSWVDSLSFVRIAA